MYEQYLDLRSVLDVLRRRFRLVVGVFAAVLLLTSGIVFSLAPKYSASVLLMVDPSRKDLLDPTAVQGTSSAGDSARVDSEVEIVESYATMLRVVEAEGLLADPEFRPALGMIQRLLAPIGLASADLPTREDALAATVAELMAAVSVRRRGLTYVIAITADAASAKTAARIANAVAAAYIETQLQSKVASVLGSLDVLEPRIAEAMEALAASESAFDSFVDTHLQDIVDGTDRSDIAALSGLVAMTSADAADLNARLAAASASLASGEYRETASMLQSQTLAELAGNQAAVRERLASTAVDDPQGTSLRAEVDRLSAQIETIARGELDGLRRRVSSALETASTLRDDLRRTVLGGAMPPETLTRIYQLQQSSTLARENYERLIARVNELSTQAAVQVADSRIVAPATPPSAPSYPNVRLALTLAGGFGLALGMVLALVSEAHVGGFRSSEQLASVTRRDVAASIPAQRHHWRSDHAPHATVPDTIVTAPLSSFSERLRLLRLRVDEALMAVSDHMPGARLVVVTSSDQFEGKTTTAIALARTYDAAGAKVLLIDCDLRQPTINRLLGIEASHGLLDYVAGRVDGIAPASIMGRDPLSGVSVVVGVGQSEVPTERMLTGASFSRLLEAARKTFDVVILDTPAVDVFVDGIYAIQHADAVLFVTKWGQTTQRQVSRSLAAVERAKRSGVPVLLALTQVPEPASRQREAGFSPVPGHGRSRPGFTT